MNQPREGIAYYLQESGYKPDRDHVRMVELVSSGRSGLVANADKLLTPHFLDIARQITGLDIVEVDFSKEISVIQLKELLDLTTDDCSEWSKSGRYFVAHNFDVFLLNNLDKLPTNEESQDMAKLLKRIQKYGHGVMLGLKDPDYNKTLDLVAEAANRDGTGSGSYYVHDVMLECAEDSVVGKRIQV